MGSHMREDVGDVSNSDVKVKQTFSNIHGDRRQIKPPITTSDSTGGSNLATAGSYFRRRVLVAGASCLRKFVDHARTQLITPPSLLPNAYT